MHSDTVVFGIGNIPIGIKGMSKPLKWNWDSVQGNCQLMVLTTLEGVDVILGMDVLSRFHVQIDTKSQIARPGIRQEVCAALVLKENYKIPAGKSRVFFLKNTLQGLTLFEPSDNLPEGLLGVPTLSKGRRVAVQLDNLSEKDVLLN